VNKHFSVLAEARPVRAAAKVWSLALLGLLTVQQAHAQAAAAGAANTLGGRMQAASSDLTVGGGYILQILGYLLGGAAVLSGVYAIWQHTKNPDRASSAMASSRCLPAARSWRRRCSPATARRPWLVPARPTPARPRR